MSLVGNAAAILPFACVTNGPEKVTVVRGIVTL